MKSVQYGISDLLLVTLLISSWLGWFVDRWSLKRQWMDDVDRMTESESSQIERIFAMQYAIEKEGYAFSWDKDGTSVELTKLPPGEMIHLPRQ